MIMNLTCPECGNKFEIEESHQAKEKQAAALKKQREQSEKETQKLLAEQKQQLVKEQDNIVEAAVQKQLEEKQAAALKAQQENLQQQTQQLLAKKDRESEEALNREKSQSKLEKDRLAAEVSKLQARVKRDQAVELIGEAAEERLKEALKQRFPDDTILDVPKGKKGADLEQHVTLKGSTITYPPSPKKSIGMILIERKSTKSFLKPWVPKLKKEVENSGAKIGVIVTDVMPKIHKDKSYYPESSTISVLRADVAVDMIEIIRENLIKSYREEVVERATQDIELTANVFAYITGEGRKHLEDILKSLKDKKELLDSKDKEHQRIMKKDWKNLEDQVAAITKLGEGLKEASNEKVNVLGTTIKIEGR